MKKMMGMMIGMLVMTLLASPVYGAPPSYLFVLSGESGSFEGDTLTLNDVPLVVYFSDRPYRVAGHMSLEKFVELWGKGSDSFKADPPNATLSIFGEQGNKDVVVELMEPRIKEATLVFRVRLLKGNIAKSFGAASIFIDAFPLWGS